MSSLYKLLTTPDAGTSSERCHMSRNTSSSSLTSSTLTRQDNEKPKRRGRFSKSAVSETSDSNSKEESSRSAQHLDNLEWSKIQKSSSSKRLHEMPSEIIRNAWREKRSRGYIARMLAAKQKKSVNHNRSRSPHYEITSPARKRINIAKSSESLPLSPLIEPDIKCGINMRKWRVKGVVEDHVKMMRALSPATLSTVKMPGDLKHMDLKPRLLGSDRTTIIGYQEEMQSLLESEYGILRRIQEHFRSSQVSRGLGLRSGRFAESTEPETIPEYQDPLTLLGLG